MVIGSVLYSRIVHSVCHALRVLPLSDQTSAPPQKSLWLCVLYMNRSYIVKNSFQYNTTLQYFKTSEKESIHSLDTVSGFSVQRVGCENTGEGEYRIELIKIAWFNLTVSGLIDSIH